jgi:hypothetical protein
MNQNKSSDSKYSVQACAEYLILIQNYLDLEKSLDKLQTEYLSKFKNEKRNLDAPAYELLQRAFGDIDSCTNDFELLASNPDFYLSELSLRKNLTTTVKDIELLSVK